MTTLNSDEVARLLSEIVLGLSGEGITPRALAKVIEDETGLSAKQSARVADAVLTYARMYHETCEVASRGGQIEMPFDMPYEE